jgi:hypothetical protein
MEKNLFEMNTPLGFSVRCTAAYWRFVVSEKHPVMVGREDNVQRVLAEPDVVRRSRQDPQVYLFYRQERSRWLCAVVRRENASGFLITTYPTDVIKAGEIVWKRSK